jgi:hypothetical protein
MQMKPTPFKFWVPIEEISKAKKPGDDKEIMILGGIASTSDEDTDEEELIPEGFDISYLKERGFVNWNHKKDPEYIIGEPIEAVNRKGEGLYVKAQLYPDSDLAKKVYKLANTLKKNSKIKRRLGFSIEGRATERDPLNPKRVLKALITGIAITHSPKNPKSIIDIIKGNIEPDEDDKADDINIDEELKSANGGNEVIVDVQHESGKRIQVTTAGKVTVTKCMDTTQGAALNKESLDKKLKNVVSKGDDPNRVLTKAEIFDRIFQLDSVISFDKANDIFDQITKTVAMKHNKDKTAAPAVTNDKLEKALSTLGLSSKKPDTDEDLEKGEGDEETTEDDEVSEAQSNIQKANVTVPKKPTRKAAPAPSKADEDNAIDIIVKSVTDEIGTVLGENQAQTVSLVKSLGVLVADARKQAIAAKEENKAELEKAMDEVELLKYNQNKMIDQFNEILEKGNGRKATTKANATSKPVERTFEKSNATDGDQGTKVNTLSISKNRGQILNILDAATFEKGFNDDLAKSMTGFEQGNGLNAIAQATLKEKGFNVVA